MLSFGAQRMLPRADNVTVMHGFVALCPELDVASQGDTVEEANSNLAEALGLFFETASPTEVEERLHREVYVTHLDVEVG